MTERIDFHSDITVVGAGIAGLWTAKEFVDQGLNVAIVEQAPALATGQTTKNEGWLHAGSYHAAAMDFENDALSVARKIRYGHEKILEFAPDAIDHVDTYALLGSDAAADRAVERWRKAGIPFGRMADMRQFEQEGIDTERLSGIFSVEDKSVNTIRLCEKLADYVVNNGGRIFTRGLFTPESATTADLDIDDGAHYRMRSNNGFLIAAGNGTRDIAEVITGEEMPMRYFKSHLLVFPRMTRDNYFHVDGKETGFMNHGNVSVAGLNRDSINLSVADYEVVPEKEEMLYSALVRIIPKAARYVRGTPDIVGVACIKPDIDRGGSQPGLDEEIIDIAPGYVGALPGKMTEAPHLAKDIVEHMQAGRHFIADALPQEHVVQQHYVVNPRPADIWAANSRHEYRPDGDEMLDPQV
jgi:hypothetical protein